MFLAFLWKSSTGRSSLCPPYLSSYANAVCFSQVKPPYLYFCLCVPSKALDRATWMPNMESGLRNSSQLSKSWRNNGVYFVWGNDFFKAPARKKTGPDWLNTKTEQIFCKFLNAPFQESFPIGEIKRTETFHWNLLLLDNAPESYISSQTGLETIP